MFWLYVLGGVVAYAGLAYSLFLVFSRNWARDYPAIDDPVDESRMDRPDYFD